MLALSLVIETTYRIGFDSYFRFHMTVPSHSDFLGTTGMQSTDTYIPRKVGSQTSGPPACFDMAYVLGLAASWRAAGRSLSLYRGKVTSPAPAVDSCCVCTTGTYCIVVVVCGGSWFPFQACSYGNRRCRPMSRLGSHPAVVNNAQRISGQRRRGNLQHQRK